MICIEQIFYNASKNLKSVWLKGQEGFWQHLQIRHYIKSLGAASICYEMMTNAVLEVKIQEKSCEDLSFKKEKILKT